MVERKAIEGLGEANNLTPHLERPYSTKEPWLKIFVLRQGCSTRLHDDSKDELFNFMCRLVCHCFCMAAILVLYGQYSVGTAFDHHMHNTVVVCMKENIYFIFEQV